MGKKILFLLFSTNLRIVRTIVLWALSRNNGQFYSLMLREIFKEIYGVDVGLYTHGACFTPHAFSPYTKIGRYCSIAESARAFNRNHPVDFISSHAFFFNPSLSYCEKDLIEYIPLEIGHDVWIGNNATILSAVRTIGTGAVIGAGAVVNKDVPPYAIVLGNPARIVRYRFSADTMAKLLESQWWKMSIEEIKQKHFTKFIQPYEENSVSNEALSETKPLL